MDITDYINEEDSSIEGIAVNDAEIVSEGLDTSTPNPFLDGSTVGWNVPTIPIYAPDPAASLNVESDNVRYELVTKLVTYPIEDYDTTYLSNLEENGAVFYAVMKDGTRVQIDKDDIRVLFNLELEEELDLAASIAEAKNQYFWSDTNGAHIAEEDQLTFEDAAVDEFEDFGPGHYHHNILLNSLGILLRQAYFNLATITKSAITFYDGNGNTTDNIRAMFGSDGAQIGRTVSEHLTIDARGITAYKGDGELAELIAIIDGARLRNATITGSKIAGGTIEDANIQDGTITGAKIAASTITGAKIASSTITSTHIKNSTITNSDIKSATITGAKIAASTIDNTNIKDGTITGSKIIGSTLTDIPYAEIDELKTRNISASDIEAATGYINALVTLSITANDINADHGIIANLNTNYAHLTNGVIDNAKIGYADVNGLSVNYAHILNGVIDNATIDVEDVNNLSANYAHILNGVINNAKIDVADVNNISANYAHILNGVINNAKIDVADVNNISANYAHITNGVIDNAKIGHADVNGLIANYAKIDISNVNNSWITNGVIKNGSISDALISSVSANKLTAGTIDASVITVTNLQADNISVTRINGQVVTGKSVSDALTQHESDISGLDNKIDNAIDDLNGRIDAQIQTYTSNTVPTLNNYPAEDWTTNDLKTEHIGDILYVLNAGNAADGYTYRFAYDNTSRTYSWVLIKDNQVTAALQRLVTAEGNISSLQSFQSTTTTWMNNTDDGLTTIRQNYTSLQTTVNNKVDVSTFNTLQNTVSQNSSSINTITQTLDSKADSSTVATLSNTVNTVSQKANSNSSTITNLTTRLGTNADGTSNANDVVSKVSSVTQDLNGFKTTVSNTYATKTSVEQAESKITQNASNISLKVSKNEVISEINASSESITIDSNRVNIEGATIFTTGRLSQTSLNNAYDANGAASNVASSAVSDTHYIYIQAPANTSSVNAPSSWVNTTSESVSSDTTGLTPVWTTKRPTYRSNYPVIFVAIQRKTVSGTVTCSTPVKDDTLTVIDGGHITTGTIDASVVTVTNINADNITSGEIDASEIEVSNLNADNITSGTLSANRIDVSSLRIGYSQITNPPSIPSNVSQLNNDANYVTNANVNHTNVSISVTSIDYITDTAVLNATLYIDGVAKTTNVTYQWIRDGVNIAGATNRSLTVTSSMGLEHVYSCIATY